MNDKDRKECQICERKIMAKSGTVAHHGYTRPGNGWQTGSCPGAKEFPYEVSCELIPPIIESIKNFKAMKQQFIADMKAKPPVVLTKTYKNLYSGETTVETFDRPENFNVEKAVNNEFSYYEDYYKQFHIAIYSAERDIKGAEEDIVRLTARVENWVKKG